MEKIVLDTAIKFGAGRYRQEDKLLEQCGAEIARFSKKAFLLAGHTAFAVTKDRLLPGIEAAGVESVPDEVGAVGRARHAAAALAAEEPVGHVA